MLVTSVISFWGFPGGSVVKNMALHKEYAYVCGNFPLLLMLLFPNFISFSLNHYLGLKPLSKGISGNINSQKELPWPVKCSPKFLAPQNLP